jgi:hypothetical protein
MGAIKAVKRGLGETMKEKESASRPNGGLAAREGCEIPGTFANG